MPGAEEPGGDRGQKDERKDREPLGRHRRHVLER